MNHTSSLKESEKAAMNQIIAETMKNFFEGNDINLIDGLQFKLIEKLGEFRIGPINSEREKQTVESAEYETIYDWINDTAVEIVAKFEAHIKQFRIL